MDDDTSYSYIRWDSQSLLPPFSFRLIATIPTINGVDRDEELLIHPVNGAWPSVGYIVLRKQLYNSVNDYIDIVKHSTSGSFPFTWVPPNSGIEINDPQASVGVNTDNLTATRGGISSNLSSLRFSGYNINLNTDFQLVAQAEFIPESDNSLPLPVELSSFSAVKIGSSVKLSWQTTTEVNNFGFEILRQVHTSTPLSVTTGWEKIGFVNGNGNSNSPKDYSYEDRTVTSGKYSYRLKQIDNDGQFEYSKVIEVNLNGPVKFELNQNYPNPFNPVTTIRFSIPEAGNVRLTLFNILGQELRTLVNEFKEAGIHTINLSAGELNSGLYIYKLESNGLTQTRKMTLVK